MVDKGFQSSGTGEVLVRLFPRTVGPVVMRPEAARHLVRLLERYNWAISEPTKQADRWRSFWPEITTIERSMVVMFVSSARDDGLFRGAVELGGLPDEVADAAGERKLVPLDPAVAREFTTARQLFECSLVTQEELLHGWWRAHPDVMREHEETLVEALQSWWSGDREEDLDDHLRTTLFCDGMRAGEATRVGLEMSLTARQLIREREGALCRRGGPTEHVAQTSKASAGLPQ